jgi:nucleoid-associated protein YgaU
MLKEKYEDVLTFGETLDVKDGYVHEEGGKLKIGGTVPYQYDCDRLWDKIKVHNGWEADLEVDIKVSNSDIYGHYTVESGDTLWKIAKGLLGSGNRYMEIFNLNKDVLNNPDVIKVGQDLKLPRKS